MLTYKRLLVLSLRSRELRMFEGGMCIRDSWRKSSTLDGERERSLLVIGTVRKSTVVENAQSQ